MTSRNLNKIIRESVRKTLIKESMLPTDNEGNMVSQKKNTYNHWKILNEFVKNVENRMNITWRDKRGNISNQDVDDVLEYIDMSLDSLYDILKLYGK